MRQKVIELLRENARLTNAEIAVRLGINEADVARVIQEAEDQGDIRGYHTILAEGVLASRDVTSLIEVKLTPERDRGFDRIAERIARFPEVESCWLMSGSYDLLVAVKGPDVHSVARFIAERLSPLEGVTATTTHFRLKVYKEGGVMLTTEKQLERLPVSP